ncbi:MAG TPA: hypothetical protein VGN89_11835 [Phenylobacterium sp.]|nr:hypothetical protein [Phenylobacterium sp.]
MSFIQSAKRLALGGAAALVVGAPAWAQAHDGDWTGSLKTPSGQELHLILHVTTKAGATDAVLDSVDQGVTIPAAAYQADGAKVSILFLAVGGELEGEFAPDGKTFAGTWKQGATTPLTLTRQAPGK